MGQLVTTVVGAGIGFLIAGPLGASIGASIGGAAGSYIFAPTIQGPRLNDLKVTASTYGSTIPEIYGTVRIGGNIIWSTGIQETSQTSRAGKGGPKQKTYSYFATFATALCEGPIDSVTRIWADNKLIFDNTAGQTRRPYSPPVVPNNRGGILLNARERAAAVATARGLSNGGKIRFRTYRGTEDQLPDSLIEADRGVGNVSAHRGLAYLVFENLALEDYGNRIPQLTFEVTKTLVNSFPNLEVLGDDGGVLEDITRRDWYPDWENERLLSTKSRGDDSSAIIDMTSMRVMFEAPIFIGGSGRSRFIPEDAEFAVSGLANSSPLVIYDTLTLSVKEVLGITSISTGGFVDVEEGTYAIGNLGPVGYGYFNGLTGRGRHIICTNRGRTTWGLRRGSQFPIFQDTETPWIPDFYIPGKTDGASSDIIGYRNAEGELQLLVWSISSSADYQIIPGVPPRWEGSKAFSRTVVKLRPYAGEEYVSTVCLYDPTDDCIFSIGLSGGFPTAFKYNRTTGTYKFIWQYPDFVTSMPQFSMRHSRIAGGTFGWGFSGFRSESLFNQIDLQTGYIIRNITWGSDGESIGSSLAFGQSQYWDDISSSLLVETELAYRRIYFTNGIERTFVKEMVRDICLKTNILLPDDIDITGFNDDSFVGYSVDRQTTPRDLLKQLATAFLFDGFESDYKLKFRSRGNEPSFQITEDWLTADDKGTSVTESITQELEMPMRVSVNYYDVTRDHQQGTQSEKRLISPIPAAWARNEENIELPITWEPDDAKQTAVKLLNMVWANRASYSMGLPWRFMVLDPADVGTIVLDDGTQYTIRFSSIAVGADLSIEADGVSEKPAAYISNARGSAGIAPEQIVESTFPSFPLIINTPLLRDIDYDGNNNATCYVSAGTNATSFTGTVIYVNDGFEYNAIGAISRNATIGTVLQPLPKTNSYEATDEKTIIRVRLNNPSALLESVNQEDLLDNPVNAAYIGGEVIQFREATQDASGLWLLSGILRARRGTNYAVNNHVAGERFVLLNENAITSFKRPPADYNITRDFKSVAPATLVEDATVFPAQLIPRDIMPYTPEAVKITDNGIDITITMQRRSRITAPLIDDTDTIHYREGEKISARMRYRAWTGLGIENAETQLAPTTMGEVPLFNAAGDDIPIVITIPIATLNSQEKLLFRAAEFGVVEGIPKWIAFERLGQNRWNAVELY